MKMDETLDVLLRFEITSLLAPNNTSFSRNINMQRQYFTCKIVKTGSLFDY